MAGFKQTEVDSSLSILDKLGTDNAEKFIHRVISDMCDKEGVHYEEFSKSISLSEYSNLKLFLSNLLRNLSREKIQRESVVAKLQELSVSEDISQIITTCLWVRKDEIRAHLVSASCNISHGHLNDFDWKLKLVMASDQLGSIQRPLVNVDFDITQDGQRTFESIELSKEELESFISSLEAANKVVMQLRT